MRAVTRAVIFLLFCAVIGTGGCAMFESDITYNPYVRNRGEKPVLKVADEAMDAPFRAMNWLDRRFENTVY